MRALQRAHQVLKFNFFILGENPAVAVNTTLLYKCPEGQKLSHDWYAPPVVKITCTEAGLFTRPADWGQCEFRKNTTLAAVSKRTHFEKVLNCFSCAS
jgi:hypothetical protein